MPVQGLTNGAQPVTGYNYGAGAYERVRTSIRFSVAVTVGYAAAFWVVAMLFPGALIRIFNQEPEVIAAGVPAVHPHVSPDGRAGSLCELRALQAGDFLLFAAQGNHQCPTYGAPADLDGNHRGIRG